MGHLIIKCRKKTVKLTDELSVDKMKGVHFVNGEYVETYRVQDKNPPHCIEERSAQKWESRS